MSFPRNPVWSTKIQMQLRPIPLSNLFRLALRVLPSDCAGCPYRLQSRTKWAPKATLSVCRLRTNQVCILEL
jgi:hypothetical protein